MSERRAAEEGIRRLLTEHRLSGFYTHAYVECGSLTQSHPTLSLFEGDTQQDIFDLASLTKALVTTPLVFRFLFEKKLKVEAPLSAWFTAGHKKARLPESLLALSARELLAHTSGLPAWRSLWVNRLSPESTLATLERSRLPFLETFFKREAWDLTNKGDRYSDIGFILLGYCLEVLEEADIPTLFDEILKDAKCSADQSRFFLRFFDDSLDISRAIPTGFCPVRQRLLRGEVHDENAAALGGHFSHAGLFGTGPSLGTFLKRFFQTGLGQAVYKENARYISERKESSLLGFRQGNDPSADTFARGFTMGHLGFTGTAFWIDPKANTYALFLTNRVISGRVNPLIKKVRREVFQYLDQLV